MAFIVHPFLSRFVSCCACVFHILLNSQPISIVRVSWCVLQYLAIQHSAGGCVRGSQEAHGR
jgi:hypothetical protein